MSLLSLLFGCGGRQSDKPKQELPWFPESDNPVVQAIEISLDSGYSVQTFLVAPERKEVYVLAHNRVVMSNTHRLEERWRTDYQLLHLDSQGKILHEKKLSNAMNSDPAFLWLERDALVFFGIDKCRLFNAATMELIETLPNYRTYDFPSSKKLVELFPEEQLELYLPAREQAIQKSETVKILNLPKAGGTVLMLESNRKKRSFWSILDEEELDKFRQTYAIIEPPLNPQWKYNPETGLYRVGDEGMVLETSKQVSMGTQLDYPNYKSRFAMQYLLTLGAQKARFATNDRSRKPLYLQISQNDYLSTGGGEVWLGYDGTLYRMFLTK